MTHYHLINRVSGEECIVTSLKGHSPKFWKRKTLAREPNPHENAIRGKLVNNDEREQRSLAEARFNMMHKGDLMLLIEGLEARIAELEKGGLKL